MIHTYFLAVVGIVFLAILVWFLVRAFREGRVPSAIALITALLIVSTAFSASILEAATALVAHFNGG